MRMGQGAAAVFLVTVLATPAFAQVYRTFGFGSSDVAAIHYEVVDTSQAAAPIATPQTNNYSFSLANILPKLNFFSNKTVIGVSQFPSSDGMPGKNYLKAFGFSRAQPIR
jgi:hypothetical protein